MDVRTVPLVKCTGRFYYLNSCIIPVTLATLVSAFLLEGVCHIQTIFFSFWWSTYIFGTSCLVICCFHIDYFSHLNPFHLLVHPFSRVFGFAFVLVLRWYAWAIYTKNWEEFWETVLLTPLGMCLKQWRMQRYWNSMFKKWMEK